MKPAAGLFVVCFASLFVCYLFVLLFVFSLFVVCEHVVTCQGVVSCEACGRFVLSRYFPDRLLATRLNAKLSASLFHFSPHDVKLSFSLCHFYFPQLSAHIVVEMKHLK